MVFRAKYLMNLFDALLNEAVIKSFDNVLCLMVVGAVLISQLNSSFAYFCLKAAALMLLFRYLIRPVPLGKVKWIFALIVAFESFRVLSSLLSSDPYQSFTVFKIRLVYYTVFMGIVVVMSEENMLVNVIKLFIYSVSIISSVEVLLFISDIMARHLYPSEYRIGYFSHPITTAQIKMMATLLIISLIYLEPRKIIKQLNLALLLVPVLLSLLLTNSRWPFIVLFSLLFFMGIVFNKKLALAVGTFLVIYLTVLPHSINGRILTSADPENQSTAARIYMLSTGLEIAADNPLTGTGNIDLSGLYRKHKHIDITGEGNQLHNDFIQLLATNGIPGLLLWLMLMSSLIIFQFRIIKNAGTGTLQFNMGVISLLCTLSFLACGMTDWNYADPGCVLIFWFFASLAFVAERIEFQRTHSA